MSRRSRPAASRNTAPTSSAAAAGPCSTANEHQHRSHNRGKCADDAETKTRPTNATVRSSAFGRGGAPSACSERRPGQRGRHKIGAAVKEFQHQHPLPGDSETLTAVSDPRVKDDPFAERGYAYSTIEVATDSDREAMRQQTGYETCPLVLLGDEVIGKLEETVVADRAGRLATSQPQRATTTESQNDIEALTALNSEYIHSDRHRDVARYQELLADDYRATLPDLVFRDKQQFLRMLSDAPRPFTDLKAHDLEIRVLGDIALIRGRVTFTNLDGTPSTARYTDTWARRDSQWVCIAADVIAKDTTAQN